MFYPEQEEQNLLTLSLLQSAPKLYWIQQKPCSPSAPAHAKIEMSETDLSLQRTPETTLNFIFRFHKLQAVEALTISPFFLPSPILLFDEEFCRTQKHSVCYFWGGPK